MLHKNDIYEKEKRKNSFSIYRWFYFTYSYTSTKPADVILLVRTRKTVFHSIKFIASIYICIFWLRLSQKKLQRWISSTFFFFLYLFYNFGLLLSWQKHISFQFPREFWKCIKIIADRNSLICGVGGRYKNTTSRPFCCTYI